MSRQPGLPGIPAGSDAGHAAGGKDAALSIEAAAVRFLAVREHSTRELRDKLSARFADTGLVEQVLASHPAVFGAGELIHINQIANQLHKTLNSTQFLRRITSFQFR